MNKTNHNNDNTIGRYLYQFDNNCLKSLLQSNVMKAMELIEDLESSQTSDTLKQMVLNII